MLAKNGYFELNLWNNHRLQVFTAAKLGILNHPLGCDENCRDKMLKYILDEGILDEVDKIVILDSYCED